jgi:hypothetical protein
VCTLVAEDDGRENARTTLEGACQQMAAQVKQATAAYRCQW